MMKQNNSAKVGLSAFKEVSTPVEKKPKAKVPAPKELKISELLQKF